MQNRALILAFTLLLTARSAFTDEPRSSFPIKQLSTVLGQCLWDDMAESVPRPRSGHLFDNSLRENLASGKIVYGACETGVCDASLGTRSEHGGFLIAKAESQIGRKDGINPRDAQSINRKIQNSPAVLLVELPSADDKTILNIHQFLDAGSGGVIVPVKSAADIQRIRNRTLYPSDIPGEGGARGVGPAENTRYLESVPDAVKHVNATTALVFKINHADALPNIRAIVNEPRVDVLLLDAAAIGASIKPPVPADHPSVRAAIDAIEAAVREQNRKLVQENLQIAGKNAQIERDNQITKIKNDRIEAENRLATEKKPLLPLKTQLPEKHQISLGWIAKSRADALAKHGGLYNFVIMDGDPAGMITQAREKFFSTGKRDPNREYAPPEKNSRVALAQQLRQGTAGDKLIFGSFTMGTDPVAIQALSGGAPKTGSMAFNFLDGEHHYVSPEDVKNYSKRMGGTLPLVRIPRDTIDAATLDAYRKAGATGFVAPTVNTVEEAMHFVSAAKGSDVAAGTKPYRGSTLSIIMIESPTGLKNLPEILSKVHGIDAVWIGPYDYSLAKWAGEGGPQLNPRSPSVVEDVKKVEAVARSKGIALGGAAPDLKTAQEMAERGYRVFTIVSDQESYKAAYQNFYSSGPQRP